ncbi:F-box domain-containing protein [Mycena chlorophos]|uniref:F-box domain-containing protein n=1 Tax=Mycena chlorophos TaxID=658473 RepID=A0A8H6VZE3_MYCCL|nr:F-box domain-containing protein [Mycena chlorophos]
MANPPRVTTGKTPAYVEANVPLAMPLPTFNAKDIVIRKHDAYAVPDLSVHQRSFLVHVVLKDYDLAANLTRDENAAIKKAALAGKPFQHVSRDAAADAVEEAKLAEEIAQAIKASGRSTKGNTEEDDSRGTDIDATAKGLRGYCLAGWGAAIQKLVTNIAYSRRRKAKVAAAASSSNSNSNTVEMSKNQAMKILDLSEYAGRQKFTTEKRDEILDLARSYEGSNAGANFNRAAAALWEKTDQSFWEQATEAEIANIPEAERITMLKTVFCGVLEEIQEAGRLPPFVATIQFGHYDDEAGGLSFEVGEVVPPNSTIQGGFHAANSVQSRQYMGLINEWAATPLKEMLDARTAEANPPPAFYLTEDAADELPGSEILKELNHFLAASYAFRFNTSVVDWDAISKDPDQHYDSVALGFPLRDPATLSASERRRLVAALGRVAGPGMPCLLHKPAKSVKRNGFELRQTLKLMQRRRQKQRQRRRELKPRTRKRQRQRRSGFKPQHWKLFKRRQRNQKSLATVLAQAEEEAQHELEAEEEVEKPKKGKAKKQGKKRKAEEGPTQEPAPFELSFSPRDLTSSWGTSQYHYEVYVLWGRGNVSDPEQSIILGAVAELGEILADIVWLVLVNIASQSELFWRDFARKMPLVRMLAVVGGPPAGLFWALLHGLQGYEARDAGVLFTELDVLRCNAVNFTNCGWLSLDRALSPLRFIDLLICYLEARRSARGHQACFPDLSLDVIGCTHYTVPEIKFLRTLVRPEGLVWDGWGAFGPLYPDLIWDAAGTTISHHLLHALEPRYGYEEAREARARGNTVLDARRVERFPVYGDDISCKNFLEDICNKIHTD